MSAKTQEKISRACDEIKNMLIEKNKSYGDSVMSPVRIFSTASTTEQIAVRIDDKLSRVIRGHEYVGDNDIDDLIGYLVFLKIKRNENKNENA